MKDGLKQQAERLVARPNAAQAVEALLRDNFKHREEIRELRKALAEGGTETEWARRALDAERRLKLRGTMPDPRLHWYEAFCEMVLNEAPELAATATKRLSHGRVRLHGGIR